MSAGRIGTSVVEQVMRRLILALLAVALLVTLGTAMADRPSASSAAESARAQDPCTGTAPIPASALAHGLAAGCALTGRTVVDGAVSVDVPPPGVTVAADGLQADGPTLVVSNRNGVLYSGAAASAGSFAAPRAASTTAATASAKLPADCRSTEYKLENGRHPWRTTIKWKLRAGSVPKRMKVAGVLSRLKSAFAAWRYDRNDCGYGGQAKRLRDAYAGTTRTPTGIAVHGQNLSCGSYNHTNTVEFGPLPGDVLGWTCYWWSTSGAMIAFDARLDNGAEMALSLPRACRGKWDLQSIATHEFGHAIGLAHVSNAAQTMHGVSPSCSTAPRTLGRGDRRGLQALYGLT